MSQARGVVAKGGDVNQAESVTKSMSHEYQALARVGQGMSEKEWAGSSRRERGLGVGGSVPHESAEG